MENHLLAVVVVVTVAVLAPILVEMNRRFRLPVILFELGFGMLVGPHALNLVPGGPLLQFFSDFGLAFLFFMAGFEIDFSRLRGRPLRLAGLGWLLSLAVAFAAAAILEGTGFVVSTVLIAVTLCTTTLGTLLPILRDAGEMQTRFGTYVLAAGAVGELCPLLMIALLLTQGQNNALKPLLLVGFCLIVVSTAWIALRYEPPRIVEILGRTLNATSQLPIRLCIFVLMVLVYIAYTLGFDMILGAFAAGMVIAMLSTGQKGEILRQKLDGLGYGLFIPTFFIATGVKFDFPALTESLQTVLRIPVFLLFFLVVRGVPATLYRRDLAGKDLVSLALYSATALPLVVAVTEIGKATGRMLPANAAALVGAGMLSIMIFPITALTLRRAKTQAPAASEPGCRTDAESDR